MPIHVVIAVLLLLWLSLMSREQFLCSPLLDFYCIS